MLDKAIVIAMLVVLTSESISKADVSEEHVTKISGMEARAVVQSYRAIVKGTHQFSPSSTVSIYDRADKTIVVTIIDDSSAPSVRSFLFDPTSGLASRMALTDRMTKEVESAREQTPTLTGAEAAALSILDRAWMTETLSRPPVAADLTTGSYELFVHTDLTSRYSKRGTISSTSRVRRSFHLKADSSGRSLIKPRTELIQRP
ncbi:MAG: hypothetical protein IAI49_03205 [Candidatus Eremiobacteraeota bacterium]|nr:hypothetical protein [Candidatus Eremiobacteraeota bacterium]